MSEKWLDVAYINIEEAILHGRIMEGHGDARKEREVRVELTELQKGAIDTLGAAHDLAMQRLLRSFAA